MIKILMRAVQVRWLLGLLMLGIGVQFLAQETFAQAAVGEAQGAGQLQAKTLPWNINCADANGPTGFNCNMSRALVVGDNNTLVMRLTVNRTKESDAPALLLQLPHGMYLPAGISVGVDDGSLSQEVVQTCDSAGCYAGLGANDTMLGALRRGAILKVSFQNLSKSDVNINFPLDGFTAAYAQMAEN